MQNFRDEMILASEIADDQRMIDPGFLRDFANADGFDAVLGKKDGGYLQDSILHDFG